MKSGSRSGSGSDSRAGKRSGPPSGADAGHGAGAAATGSAGTAAETDALFKLPLGEFTAARNALAARLKKAGHGAEADRIKSLPKPSVSAWVVNQLYWQHRQAFDHLIAIGERFRKAQAAQMAGRSADLRGTLDARRAALSDLARLAAGTLTGGGNSATPDMMRRITTTLEAMATYGTIPEAPPAGRLVDDVQPPGFESLAALVPRIGETTHEDAGPSRVLPFRQERQARRAAATAGAGEDEHSHEEARKAKLAAAAAAVKAAEHELAEARKAGARAEAALKEAAARTRDAEQEKANAEQRLEQAAQEATEARQHARSVAAAAEQAAQVIEDAERSLEKARQMAAALQE